MSALVAILLIVAACVNTLAFRKLERGCTANEGYGAGILTGVLMAGGVAAILSVTW